MKEHQIHELRAKEHIFWQCVSICDICQEYIHNLGCLHLQKLFNILLTNLRVLHFKLIKTLEKMHENAMLVKLEWRIETIQELMGIQDIIWMIVYSK